MAKSFLFIPLFVLAPLLVASEDPPEADESVQILDVIINADAVSFSYAKNFSPCAHLFTDEWQRIGEEALFCESGEGIALELTQEMLPLQGGMALWLCHSDNYALCSQPVYVMDVTPPPYLNLHKLSLGEGGLAVSFDKEMDACVALVDPDGAWVTDPGYFCDMGMNLEVVVPEENLMVTPGLPLRLCTLDDSICSEAMAVEMEEEGGGESSGGCEEDARSGGVAGNIMFLLALPIFRRKHRNATGISESI